MILPDFILTTRQNLTENFSGMDSVIRCADKDHFKKYPHIVEYNFNNRGFRDDNWPDTLEELKNAIWCFGDSFTVGLGSPIEHTWPYLLKKKTLQRCINISMDGASNAWIHRKVLKILETIKPKILVIHWSYIHRDEIDDATLSDEKRRILFNKNELLDQEALINRFSKIIADVEGNKQQTRIIHSFIPGWSGVEQHDYLVNKKWWSLQKGADWPELPPEREEDLPDLVYKEISYYDKIAEDKKSNYLKLLLKEHKNLMFVPEFKKIDLARDGHHYDIKTANYFSNKLIELFNSISSDSANNVSSPSL